MQFSEIYSIIIYTGIQNLYLYKKIIWIRGLTGFPNYQKKRKLIGLLALILKTQPLQPLS